MPERYITNSASSDRNAVAEGLKKALNLCATHSHNAVILHLPSKSQLRQLSLLLNQKLITALKKNNSGSWSSITFTLHTQRLEISDWTEDIILSLYPTSTMTDNLNDLKRAKAIVVVPWNDKEREKWIQTWNPEIIGGEEVELENLDLDPRLESALSALTGIINVSTGLTHSSDRESAIQLLKILHSNRIQLKPDNMKIWALQNEWTSHGANDLQDIAQRILEGRRFRTSGLNRWNDKFIRELLGN